MEVLIELFQGGQLPQLSQWLLLVNIIDVATGFIKAVDTKTVSSKVMKHGALTKLILTNSNHCDSCGNCPPLK